MNFERLRQLLLQKAIEGKLVPQLDEEPSVEQIGEAPKDVPFAIPEKWKWEKLGNVFSLKAGKFISASEIFSDGHPYLCYGGNGVRGVVDKYNREGRFPLIGRQGALCGNINIASGKFYATEHAVVADSNGLIDVDCAAFFLEKLNLNQYATKTAQPGLSVKKISETPFPVPPVEEQRRIVERLNDLLATLKKAEDAYKDLQVLGDNLRAKMLQKAIEGKLVPQLEEEPSVAQIGEPPKDVPFAIPEKWKWTTIGASLQYGSSEQIIGNDIPSDGWILDLEDIEKNTGKLLVKKRGCSSTSNKAVFRKGDVLYGKLRPYLNKCIVADEDGFSTTEIVAIRTVSGSYKFDPEYIKTFLMSPIFIQYANSLSYGVKMPRLGTKDAKAAVIPVPPLEEQRRIVEKLNALLPLVDQMSV